MDKRKTSMRQKIKNFFKGDKNKKATHNHYNDVLNRSETMDRLDEVEI